MRCMRRRYSLIMIDKEQLIVSSVQKPRVNFIAFVILFFFDVKPVLSVVVKSNEVAGALSCHEELERV